MWDIMSLTMKKMKSRNEKNKWDKVQPSNETFPSMQMRRKNWHGRYCQFGDIIMGMNIMRENGPENAGSKTY
jgi:hypothetical protein